MDFQPPGSNERIQRKHRRYIVNGSVMFPGAPGELFGDLVNLGRGGLLVRSDHPGPPVGKECNFHFTVHGYDRELEAGGVVVGGRFNLMAIQFLHEPLELESVLNLMEQSHCPWTGSI